MVLHACHIVWGPFGETIGNLVFFILFTFLCGFIFLSWRFSFSLVYYGELGVILKWKLIFCCKMWLARNFEIIFPYVCGFAPLVTQISFWVVSPFCSPIWEVMSAPIYSFMKEWLAIFWTMNVSMIFNNLYIKYVFPNDEKWICKIAFPFLLFHHHLLPPSRFFFCHWWIMYLWDLRACCFFFLAYIHFLVSSFNKYIHIFIYQVCFC